MTRIENIVGISILVAIVSLMLVTITFVPNDSADSLDMSHYMDQDLNTTDPVQFNTIQCMDIFIEQEGITEYMWNNETNQWCWMEDLK